MTLKLQKPDVSGDDENNDDNIDDTYDVDDKNGDADDNALLTMVTIVMIKMMMTRMMIV